MVGVATPSPPPPFGWYDLRYDGVMKIQIFETFGVENIGIEYGRARLHKIACSAQKLFFLNSIHKVTKSNLLSCNRSLVINHGGVKFYTTD